LSKEFRVLSNELKERKDPATEKANPADPECKMISMLAKWLRTGPSLTHHSSLITLYFSLFFFIGLAAGCDAKREHTLTGSTMGTTYTVKVVTGYFGSVAGLKEKVDKRLDEINRSLSPYLKESEISRFNRFQEVDVEFPVSADFLRPMRIAARLYEISGGAWDGTVNPLVDLWGFGRSARTGKVPPPEKIAALIGDIGFDKIEIRDHGTLVKRRASVTLDLSSIGQGYGVEQVVDLVRADGFTNFLVEIGGEIYAAGVRSDGRSWRIGINRPKSDARVDDIYKVVALKDRAFATSGDYRQFFIQDGVRYSHHIDPKKGYPVANGVVSVSILADNCALADGLGTAVLVMGAEKGLALIDRLEGVEALVIVELSDGSLQEHASRGILLEPPPR
jgi:thiamine biosynthesis lipoprotein